MRVTYFLFRTRWAVAIFTSNLRVRFSRLHSTSLKRVTNVFSPKSISARLLAGGRPFGREVFVAEVYVPPALRILAERAEAHPANGLKTFFGRVDYAEKFLTP